MRTREEEGSEVSPGRSRSPSPPPGARSTMAFVSSATGTGGGSRSPSRRRRSPPPTAAAAAAASPPPPPPPPPPLPLPQAPRSPALMLAPSFSTPTRDDECPTADCSPLEPVCCFSAIRSPISGGTVQLRRERATATCPPQDGGAGEENPQAVNLSAGHEHRASEEETRVTSIAAAATADGGNVARRRRRTPPRNRGLLRRWRRTAKRKWKLMFLSGTVALLFAAVLVSITVVLEDWGQQSRGSGLSDGDLAPAGELPAFFEGKTVPKIFEEYALKHNKLMQSPQQGKYIVYEMPSTTTLAQSMVGLTSTFLLALASDRALLVKWTRDYLAPGPSDVGGDSWSSSSQYADANASDFASEARKSALDEIFIEPGFWWGWTRFSSMWKGPQGLPAERLAWEEVDLYNEFESLLCSDLEDWRKDDQFIKIVNTEYFAPLLTVNPSSRKLLSEIAPNQLFEMASNWLLRPVPSIMTSVRRFQERYLEGNFVIGMEISVFSPGASEWGTMTTAQQEGFLNEARDASVEAAKSLLPHQSVVVVLVTDDEEALRSRFKSLGRDPLGNVGVIALTGPQGLGTERMHSEVQEAWLLGLADVLLISPGSGVGVLGHARTGVKPVIVKDAESVVRARNSQPCLYGAEGIKQATCFTPSMLPALMGDPDVPCLYETSGSSSSSSPPNRHLFSHDDWRTNVVQMSPSMRAKQDL